MSTYGQSLQAITGTTHALAVRGNPELEVRYASDKTVVVISEKELQTTENPMKRIWSEEVGKHHQLALELAILSFCHFHH